MVAYRNAVAADADDVMNGPPPLRTHTAHRTRPTPYCG